MVDQQGRYDKRPDLECGTAFPGVGHVRELFSENARAEPISRSRKRDSTCRSCGARYNRMIESSLIGRASTQATCGGSTSPACPRFSTPVCLTGGAVDNATHQGSVTISCYYWRS